MNKKFAPIIIILLLAVAGVAFFTTTRKPASAGLHISGNIEATTVNVSFRIPGRLKARLVDEGMTVSFGQPVATLDTEDIDQEVAQRASDAAAARAALAELQAGSRKEEVRRAEAVLVRAEAEALRLEREYARAKALFSTEVLSRQQMEAAEAAATASRAAAREAGESLALARKGPRSEQLDAARARLQSAEAVLAAARLKRGYAEVLSPINGVVLAKHAEPGEQLATGAPVVTVADLKNVWLRAYIPETELGQVKIGTPAEVTTDSYPGKKYPGKVTFISSEAEFTPRTVQTEKERVKLVYRIKISLDNPDQELKPGMPADGVLAAR